MASSPTTAADRAMADVASTEQQRQDRQAQQTVVQCVGLSKVFKDFWLRSRVKAVDDLSLDVRRGEVFGLLGPNGSGKSTTIKMILGLLHPTAGRIAVFGKRPDDVKTKSQIGYLPEETYLYRFLNARETLDYYGRLFHLPREAREQRIDTLLKMVGLEAVQRRPVGEYSKGMQRRIGLAQALINDPQLLILDEPTTGMDPIGTAQVKQLIRELAARGKTIILCSHLLSDVEDVCDREAIMFGGKLRALGTCDELLTRQDATTLTMPVLDVETIQAIEDLLEKRGMHITTVEQPRQKLESLFLDIVEQAQREGVETSGAQSGGQIAGFLTGRGEEAEGEAVLDRLVAPAAAGAAAGAAAPADASTQPNAAGGRTEPAEFGAADDVLRSLSGTDKPKPRPDSPQEAPPQQDDAADISVLDELVGPAPAGRHTTPPTPQPEPKPAPKSASDAQSNADAVDQLNQLDATPVADTSETADAQTSEDAATDDPFDAPPTPEEEALIDGLVSEKWGTRESGEPDQNDDAAPDEPKQSDDSPSASQGASQSETNGEKPFKAFLDALDDVPDVVDDDDSAANEPGNASGPTKPRK